MLVLRLLAPDICGLPLDNIIWLLGADIWGTVPIDIGVPVFIDWGAVFIDINDWLLIVGGLPVTNDGELFMLKLT